MTLGREVLRWLTHFLCRLATGTHMVTLEYRTDTVFTLNPQTDWESASLQALVLD